MKKLIEFLISKIKYIILLYTCIQLVLILTLEISYKSDSLYYYNLAQECIAQNEFYPAQKHVYEDYLVAPFYINTLIILLKLYNSILTISLFNLLIILLQMFLLYHLTIKLFSEQTAYLVLLLYIFYLNTPGLMVQNYTELYFLLLITASIFFFTLNKNIHLILSGLCLGAAIAVRPLGWALVLGFILFQLVSSMKYKTIIYRYFFVYSGTLIFIILFGGFTLLHFGKFEFTSTTGPVNLLIGANEDATGGFNATVHGQKKAGYIENPDSLTYTQKGEFYQNQAVKWITENPLKWLTLAPLKVINTYGWDDISLSSLLGYKDTNFARVTKLLLSGREFNGELGPATITNKLFYTIILFLSHLYYYLLLVSIVIGIFHYIKKRTANDVINLILFFSLIATLMIMVTVGTPRYKYPMIILLLPFASYYLLSIFKIGEKNFGKE